MANTGMNEVSVVLMVRMNTWFMEWLAMGQEGAADVLALHVVVDAVEHDHGVVERVAEDREQRGDGVRVHLATHERVDAHHQDEVVEQRDDGHDAHLVLEADGDVDDDEQDGHEEGDERALDDACAPVRADGGHFEVARGHAERLGHLVGVGRGVLGRGGRGAHEEAGSPPVSVVWMTASARRRR